jgi:hypothetical protein
MAWLGLAVVVGCAPPASVPPKEKTPGEFVEPFSGSTVLSVAITLPEEDWQALREETRSLSSVLGPGCLDGPHESPFGDHVGSVALDDETFGDVVVRKKGFLGSVFTDRPSLRLDLNEKHPDAAFRGLDHLVLNNAAQDPAVIRTCLAYGVLQKAGVPAPRCAFAHVVVNGEDLGAYVHVERPRAAFLRRWFGDDDGVLVEGTLSDFSPSWRKTFERERGSEDDTDRTIEAVLAALDADDDELLSRLDAVIDLNDFFRFWAAEVVVAHWDGYAGNRNNFLFTTSGDGRVRFIASGMDGTFHPFSNSPHPGVLAHGRLSRRLYDHPEGRTRYFAAVEDVLARAFETPALLQSVNDMSALVAPFVDDVDAFDTAIDELFAYVQTREADLRADVLAQPEWTETTPDTLCMPPAGVMSFSFSTTFGSWPTDDAFTTGDGSFAGVVEGRTLAALVVDDAPAVGAAAGFDDEGRNPRRVVVIVPAAVAEDQAVVPVLSMATSRVVPGVFDVDDTSIQVLLLGIGDDGAPFVIARAYAGTVALEQASTTSGELFGGQVDALLFASGF